MASTRFGGNIFLIRSKRVSAVVVFLAVRLVEPELLTVLPTPGCIVTTTIIPSTTDANVVVR